MSGSAVCEYVIERKQRQCRMQVKSGHRFCGEHSVLEDGNDRMICPLDGKHTVSRSELKDHIENRCNSRLPCFPWIEANYNRSPAFELLPFENSDSPAWQQLSIEEKYKKISSLRTKINFAYEQHKHKIVDNFGQHSSMEMLVNDENVSDVKRKHYIQQSSIISRLYECNLLESYSQFVEFGAGKAELTCQLVNAVQNDQSTFLVIDRAGCRQKFDNKVKQRGKVRRLRCDLEHLRLANVEEFANNNTIHMNLVGLCKHLCGVATDFAIKCVENAQKHLQFSSLFLAPCNNCCHHRCIYSEYSGRLFLESLDICESDFAALLHVSTWAVCGFSNHKDQPTTSHCDRHDCTICSFTEQDKIELGRRVKLLLELGRADHLIRIGYNVNVIYYVPFTVTPENILIVATLKKL